MNSNVNVGPRDKISQSCDGGVLFLLEQVGRFVLTDDSSLYVLLPSASTPAELQRVEEAMTHTALLGITSAMKTVVPQRAEVILPQISLDVEPDMLLLMRKLGLLLPFWLGSRASEALTTLTTLPGCLLPGLSSLFEDANLCGLYSEDRLLLDDVRHRGFLALTEQGVEVVAVTSATFSRTYDTFSALQPFVFLLWNDRANVPLFVGRVVDP